MTFFHPSDPMLQGKALSNTSIYEVTVQLQTIQRRLCNMAVHF